MKSGNRMEWLDIFDMMLLRMAKVGREKLDEAAEPEKFYNTFFNQNDVQVMGSGGDLRRIYRGEILRAAVWSRIPPQNGVIADVGCGTGDNLRYVFRPDVMLIGVEYAPQTADIARTLLQDKATVHTGSATQLPLADNSCDLVMCIEVLEHIEQADQALSEIRRILRPGGSLVLSVPYRYWFGSYLRLMGHFRHYTRTDVEQMLKHHGMGIEAYLPNFPKWARLANYCYIITRFYALFLRLFGLRRSPVEVTLPFSKTPLINLLFKRIEPLRNREAKADYSKLETSTFVVAKKPL